MNSAGGHKMSQIAFNRRILVVDDNEAIHNDVRSALRSDRDTGELDALASTLLGEPTYNPTSLVDYEISSATQGEAGFEKVKQAVAANQPFAVAFVDVRMPPGWDGIHTIKKMREVDSELQVVICSAHSDYTWNDTLKTLGMGDWLLVLKKPFDVIELQQIAYALSEKWNLARLASAHTDNLEQQVEEHAERLKRANIALTQQVASLADANRRLEQEVNARREADERIRHMAYHDSLTNLPNRLKLVESVDACIRHCDAQPGRHFAILYCDVDNFKIVNDSLGHRVGDQLLLEMSDRLRRTLASRPHGKQGDMVARLGGDEFVVLLSDISDTAEVLSFAEQLRATAHQPILLGSNEIAPTVSVGAAISSSEYGDATDLLRDADTAMYHAKDAGKGRVAVFDNDMRDKVTARMLIENELRRAIIDRQFVVHYQPIVSLETGKTVSVEALVRWQHPEKGLRSPDTFIPIAEDSGMIEHIGRIVLSDAIEQIADWRKELPEAKDLSVNINLSPRQLASSTIVPYIEDCLARHEVPHSAIRLEITESAMMDDLPLVRQILDDLTSRGIQIHLDDFGTGFSSLSILHTLPFSTIKIDRSFIRHVTMDIEHSTTIQAIVMLAQSKGMKVVAEGIETTEQLALIKELCCDFGQGYLFSRPLPAADLGRFISEYHDVGVRADLVLT